MADTSELPSGRGTFTIKRVFYKDKDGNPLVTSKKDPKALMILDVVDKKRRKATVYEHIVDGAIFDWKRDVIFASVDMTKYQVKGSNANLDQLEGLQGECFIEIKEYQGKSSAAIKTYYKMLKDGEKPFDPQERVVDVAPEERMDWSMIDDSIPF